MHYPAGRGNNEYKRHCRKRWFTLTRHNSPVQSIPRSLAAAIIAFLIAIPACVGGQAAPTPETITIGVDLPLTGDEGRAGTTTLNGIRYFVENHPTLGGHNIALDVRDDASTALRDTSRGVKNLNAFIANPHVIAMIGPFDSSVARAQIPIANLSHMAMVSPATSSRCLTKEPYLPTALNPSRTPVSCKEAGLPPPSDLRSTGTNNYFRVSTTDELQGPAAADYARKKLHLMKVAVLSHREGYGQLLANSFTARFNRLGGTVVARHELDLTATVDATVFLEQAKKAGAQGVYFGGAASNHACVVRFQMASVFPIGEATPFLGGDGIALDPTCVRDAGSNAPGIYATVPAADPEQLDSAQQLIKAFRTQYGQPGDLGPYTIAAYDATGVLYYALDRAIKAAGGGVPTRESLIGELKATTAYSGATGVFGFDAEGDTTSRVLSIFKPGGTDPRLAWKWVDTITYTAKLPY
ncbi:MAG: branched-chain amino acid ABC transporter substrate-binding protein [Candidatus Dormibacteraceae bacterium]